MSIKATVKVGKACNISLEAADPVSLIKAVSQFTQLPSKCGHCESTNLALSHRVAGDKGQYDYLHIKCGDCGATGDIGQNETPKGNVFFRYQPKDRVGVKNGFYKYWEQPDFKGSTPAQTSSPVVAADDDDDNDDVPF